MTQSAIVNYAGAIHNHLYIYDGIASGFSRSNAHCDGLFAMYSRMRFSDSSLRMMCS